jgi:Mn2+/Fe2+ NRAMP family transporter
MKNIKLGLKFGAICFFIGIVFVILYITNNRNDIFLIMMVLTLCIWTVIVFIFSRRYDTK